MAEFGEEKLDQPAVADPVAEPAPETIEAGSSLNILLAGKPGTGKSTLASTMDPPVLVILTDPPSQAGAYRKRGEPGPIEKWKYGWKQVVYRDGEPLIYILFFCDSNPRRPTVMPYFRQFMDIAFDATIERLGIKSVVLDSGSGLADLAFNYDKYSFNPGIGTGEATERAEKARLTKHALQWYGAAQTAFSDYIAGRMANMIGVNTLTIVHFQTDLDQGEVVTTKLIMAPGQFKENLISKFGEFYRAYREGEKYLIQTEARDGYNCRTFVGVPDPSVNHWGAIVANLKGGKG